MDLCPSAQAHAGKSASRPRAVRLLIDAPETSHVLDVHVPAGTTWRALREALAPWGVGEDALVEGRLVPDEVVVGEEEVPDGARITSGITQSADPGELRITTLVGPRQGQTFPLPPGETVLGRGHRLLGDDETVSRRHVAITLEHGQVQVTDPGSTGGTHLKGALLEPTRPVSWRVGERLQLGASVLRLEEQPEPSHPAEGQEVVVRPAPEVTVHWPAEPPHQTSSWGVRLLTALVPLPVAAALAWWLHSPVLLAFMALGPLTVLMTTGIERRRGQRSGHAGRRAVEEGRRRARADLAHALDAERREREALHPAPSDLVDIACGARVRPHLLGGSPAALRIGHGTSPSRHHVGINAAKHPVPLHDAPVTVPVHAGVIYVRTETSAVSDAVLESLTAQLAVLGPPAGWSAEVVTPLARSPRWCWLGHPDIPVTDHVIHEASKAPQPLQSQTRRSLLVLDSRTTQATAACPVSQGQCLIWVGSTPPPVPGQEIDVTPGSNESRLPGGEVFTLDTPHAEWFAEVTRLARRSPQMRWDDGSPSAALPAVVTPEAVGLPNRLTWDRAPTMQVPIGLDPQGEVVVLDLAQQGPHALVAGTTGSGKSEFLLAYLYGLFTLNAPGAISALLIDYKGGATFAALEDAPHVVGVVSDLDEGLGARALVALRAEIVRREAYLAAVGARSYDEALACGRAAELPRLFVIVDEFRVLAEELPDFVSGLVRLAAVGRSLGIHVVLATQRPGGVVTADMRANIDARIALRVRERSDSIDVIDSPDAALLPHDAPGRAVLAVGGEPPHHVQTMLVSAPSDTSDSHITITPVGEQAVNLLSPSHHAGQENSRVCELVLRAQEAAKEMPPPHRPLLPPLPDVLTETTNLPAISLEELTEPQPRPTPGSSRRTVAVADLPHAQTWAGVEVLLTGHLGIAGTARSGRTTAAAVCAEAAMSAGRAVWWCGSDPVAGASWVIAPSSPEEVARFISLLEDGASNVTVIIDTWEELAGTVSMLDHGLGEARLLHAMREVHRRDVRMVITGGRCVLSSRVTPLLGIRVVLHHADPGEYALAGLRPRQVPTHMPPGRGLVLPHGHQIQFLRRWNTSPSDHEIVGISQLVPGHGQCCEESHASDDRGERSPQWGTAGDQGIADGQEHEVPQQRRGFGQ